MTEPAAKQKNPEKKRLKAAEAKLKEIELERAQISLKLDKVRAKVQLEEHDYKQHADKKHGIFSLERAVGGAIPEFATEIRHWARVNPDKPITLNIFSPGGSVFHGLVLYDTLRTLSHQGHHITTVTRGYAASMGSLLFLAGDTRLIGAEAFVMFHHLAASTGGMLYEMEDDVKFYKRLNARLDKIITSRTDIDPEFLAEKCKKRDWWFGAKQAIRLGVAHEIG